MGLSYSRTIAVGSTVKDACTRNSGNEVVTISNDAKLRRWDITTGSQVGSDVTITNGEAICMLTSNLAAITNSSDTSVRIVDLPSGTVTTVTSLDYSSNSGKGQQVAGDVANGVALGVCYTSGQFIQFSSTGPTAVLKTQRWLLGGSSSRYRGPISICYKAANTFIVGFGNGMIAEVDQDGNLIRSYMLPISKILTATNASSAASSLAIWNLHYDSRGWLVASTSGGFIYLINHETGTVLQQLPYQKPSTAGTILSVEGGLTMLAYQNGATNAAMGIAQIDIFKTPMDHVDVIQAPGSGAVGVAAGIDGSNGWVAAGSNIFVYAISGVRSTTDKSVTTPGYDMELFLLDDTGGVGTSTVLFATTIASGGQTVPVSSSIASGDGIAIFSWLDGTERQYKVNRFP